MIMEFYKGSFCLSDDPARLQISVIYAFLSNESYWAKGIERSVVERSIANSVCFGVYDVSSNTQWKQVGFARVVTDKATFGYVADVFVLPEYRGNGLSKWLMERVLAHPELQGLRRWMLGTRDAHGLYASVGFAPLNRPEIFMQIHHPHVYNPVS
jgi:GNAT superfamily N-acetyltransferase